MFGQRLPVALEGINEVLPYVKKPNIYATLAGSRIRGEGEVEYITAGHVPLLLNSHVRRDVVRLSMEQFPLGLFPDVGYSSGRAACGFGESFAILADGRVETRDAWEEEFRLQRLENVLLDCAGRPLAEIYDAAIEAVHRHGNPASDRTLMLVRVRGSISSSDGSRRSTT